MSFSVGLEAWFTQDHRACDALWNHVESAADAGDPTAAASAFAAFDRALRRHLDMEEDVLFPAFEEDTGMRGGPTAVMRMEHDQMRGLLDQMGEAAGEQDVDRLLDLGDTLLMVIQQHNVKEEGMLYPVMQMHLGEQWERLVARLQRYVPPR